jgi:hypothetical protein
MSLTIPRTEYEPVPTGEYPVRLTALRFVDGDYGPQLEWTLTLLDGEHEGADLRAWSSAKFTPAGPRVSKLAAWTNALTKGKTPIAGDFSSSWIEGKAAVAVVVQETKDGKTYSRVVDLKPANIE